MITRPIRAWRLWLIQGSWNPSSLQWLGWIFAWAPWLAGRRPEEVSRFLREERGHRNTNPYLAGVAVGARARGEAELGAERARGLTDALQSALGAMGDGLFWAAARPFSANLAALLAWGFGAWSAVAVWLTFASVQGWVRAWGLRVGLREGPAVIDRLESSSFDVWARWLRAGAAIGGGALGVLVLEAAWQGMGTGWPLLPAALAIGGLGAWRPRSSLWWWGVLLLLWGLAHGGWIGPEA